MLFISNLLFYSNILTPKIERKDKLCKAGIDRIDCSECDLFYKRQTKYFNKKYKHHVSVFINKKESSNVAKHLLNLDHSTNPVEIVLELLKYYIVKGKSCMN